MRYGRRGRREAEFYGSNRLGSKPLSPDVKARDAEDELEQRMLSQDDRENPVRVVNDAFARASHERIDE